MEGRLELAELLGVYISPWALGDEAPMEIRIPQTVTAKSDAVIGELIFSDLALVRMAGGASA
jgi:hypothetical protein